MTDNRDPQELRHHDGLLRWLGIDRDKLPELVKSTDIVGTLLPEVARELGLNAGVQVVAGAVDNSAVAVGAAVRDHEVHQYLGTSSWLDAHVPA